MIIKNFISIFIAFIIVSQTFLGQEKFIDVNKYNVIEKSLNLNEKQVIDYKKIVKVLLEKIDSIINDKSLNKYSKKKLIKEKLFDTNSHILNLLSDKQKVVFIEVNNNKKQASEKKVRK